MAAENPWSVWLSRVRQAGDVARAGTLQPAERATKLIETICDGNNLCAGLLWAIDREGKFQAAAIGGVPHISGPDGQLNLDATTHLVPVKAAFGNEPPPQAVWTAAHGATFLRAIRRVVINANTPLALELFFPMARAKDKGGIDLATDEVVAVLTKALTAHASAPAINTLNDEFWRQLDQFSLSLQRSLSVADVAAVAANDGRVLLDCDRVSIAVQHGNRAKVVACSGQESTQQRANLIYQMSILAKAVCDLGEPVLYKGTTDGFPESFREPLSKYLEESRSRMVQLIPLRENIPHHQTELDLADQVRLKPGKVIACLIAEQSKDSDPKGSVSQRIDMVADHVAAALCNARHQESIFLLSVWRAVGRTLGWFRGRRLAIAIGIVAALGVVIAALSVVPWEYRFEAAGRAMPVEQYDIFAPWDGDVIQVLVENGQVVKQGQVVLVLRSDDLETELLAAENAVSERQKTLASLESQKSVAAGGGPGRRGRADRNRNRHDPSRARRSPGQSEHVPETSRCSQSHITRRGRRGHIPSQPEPARPTGPARGSADRDHERRGPLAARTRRPRVPHGAPPESRRLSRRNQHCPPARSATEVDRSRATRSRLHRRDRCLAAVPRQALRGRHPHE